MTVCSSADQMVALTERPLPVVFDASTLATMGNFQYHDSIPEGQIESAHPLHDLASQETINYFVRLGETTSYVIWRMDDHKSTRQVIAEIPVDLPAYMHSFALTEHYLDFATFSGLAHAA